MTVTSGLGTVAFLILVGITISVLRRRQAGLSPLPNGPPGDNWIVGNLLDFYSTDRWRKFSEWSKTYGDLTFLTLLGRPVVVCNKFDDAHELMDRRGAMYSDRGVMIYINDILKIRSITFMPYGDSWRAYRRLMQQHLNSRAVVMFRPVQAKCVHCLLKDLLGEPEKFWRHVIRFVRSSILSATYGYTTAHEGDPLVKLQKRTEGIFLRFGPPGFTLVDFFPILRFFGYVFPGTDFGKVAHEGRGVFREMCDLPYQKVKEQREAGMVESSMLVRMLDDAERQGIKSESHYEAIKNVCRSMYRAGVVTTSRVLYTFLLAMVVHPHVARKAQNELDDVLKAERLPFFEDRNSTPYINCILKECLRWAPPLPMGIAHRAMEEDVLHGKRIPKGSLVIPNIWYMMHDEHNYIDPESFNPDRFLTSDKESILDTSAAAFGFGRRICPGRHFAEASIWLTMASILTVFDILPIIDENGTECPPKAEFQNTVYNSPLKDFACRFVPRSEMATALVINLE